MVKAILAAVMVMVSAASAYAGCAEDVDVSHAWVRPTMPGKHMTAGFFTVENHGDAVHVLTGVSFEGGKAEMHNTVEENDVFRMRHIHKVEIPAGEKVEFSPHGLHVMFMDVQDALKEGDEIRFALQCGAETLAVTAQVTMNR